MTNENLRLGCNFLGKSGSTVVPKVPPQFMDLIKATMKQNNPDGKFNIDEVAIEVKRAWNQTKDTIKKRNFKTEKAFE